MSGRSSSIDVETNPYQRSLNSVQASSFRVSSDDLEVKVTSHGDVVVNERGIPGEAGASLDIHLPLEAPDLPTMLTTNSESAMHPAAAIGAFSKNSTSQEQTPLTANDPSVEIPKS